MQSRSEHSKAQWRRAAQRNAEAHYDRQDLPYSSMTMVVSIDTRHLVMRLSGQPESSAERSKAEQRSAEKRRGQHSRQRSSRLGHSRCQPPRRLHSPRELHTRPSTSAPRWGNFGLLGPPEGAPQDWRGARLTRVYRAVDSSWEMRARREERQERDFCCYVTMPCINFQVEKWRKYHTGLSYHEAD
jgi:hypothetical protein